MVSFTILHVSDVHFGMKDDLGEHVRITKALIQAARKDNWAPDVCIFSGDLAFSGKKDQFEQGGAWLQALVDAKGNCPLFIVPGNHDADRDKFDHILDEAFADRDRYGRCREFLVNNQRHFREFQDWHSAFSKTADISILSDWSAISGCHSILEKDGTKIRLVGLNTAILAKDNYDEGKLVQDITTLNDLLDKRQGDEDLVVAIGHHPLSWLSKWNGEMVSGLLKQKRGAHLYLHGHLHEQSAISIGSSQGAAITTLECGAAYADTDYAKIFNFYQIDFQGRQIIPRVYLYSFNSGEWIVDGANSHPIVANIPQNRSIAKGGGEHPSAAPGGPASGKKARDSERERKKADVLPASSHGSGERDGLADQIELDVHRLFVQATSAHAELKDFFSKNFKWKDRIFSNSDRIKEVDHAITKVERMRKKGRNYTAHDIGDMSGFRFVARYQSDVPRMVEEILRIANNEELLGGSVKINGKDGLTVHASRRDDDPLSIVPEIKEVAAAFPDCRLEVRSSETGYSSVHLAMFVRITSAKGRPLWVRAEVQIRSVLEEVWGQLDHSLRYSPNRGAIGSARWQHHLNVLKAHFDACAQHLDLIKELAAVDGDARPVSKNRGLSIARPEQILEVARPILTPLLYERLVAAFGQWKEADASRQRGGDPGLYRKAADTFAALLDRESDADLPPDDRQRFRYIVRMEQAYLLSTSGVLDDVGEAEAIYHEILATHTNDVAALFRLGQSLRLQGKIRDAIEQLDRAIPLAEAREASELYEGELDFIFDQARIARANCLFRAFEDADGRGEKARLISEAIAQAKQVWDSHVTDTVRVWSLNDTLYYSWEERHLLEENEGQSFTLPHEDFVKMGALLDEEEREQPSLSYEYEDTLMRVHLILGDEEKAKLAAQRVCAWLERAANFRRPEPIGDGLRRLGFQWSHELQKHLTSHDETEALVFALDVLNS